MSERRLTDAELEASRWIARLEASDVTLEDHQRFRQWLAASEENRIAHEALSRTWDKLDQLKLLGLKAPDPLKARGFGLSRRGLLLGAGGVVVAGGAGVLILSGISQPAYAAVFETPVGGRETATLPDGSIVELNADTKVRVEFGRASRTLSLERGEALFTASPDPRPFRIVTPRGAFTTGAGAFLIRLRGAAVEAAVLEGELQLSERNAQAHAPALAGLHQQVRVSAAGMLVSEESAETLERRLAWRNGMLIFDNEPLGDAIAEIERQTGAVFQLEDPSLAELRIGGAIRCNDLDAFIALLEQNLGISTRREGRNVTLLQ